MHTWGMSGVERVDVGSMRVMKVMTCTLPNRSDAN